MSAIDIIRVWLDNQRRRVLDAISRKSAPVAISKDPRVYEVQRDIENKVRPRGTEMAEAIAEDPLAVEDASAVEPKPRRSRKAAATTLAAAEKRSKTKAKPKETT